MKIAFFTNTLNNHQIGLADELYRQSGGRYVLIETQPLSEERRNMGFMEYERPYKIKAYLSEEDRQRAFDVARQADVAIMGADSYPYLEARIKAGGKLTFSFSERWLKRGLLSLLSPRLQRILCLYHWHGGKKQPWYVLCASAYLPSDYSRMFAFKDKCFQFGYFTQVKEMDIDAALASKRSASTVKILWVARFLQLKHPERMLQLAAQLRSISADFVVEMVGTGPEYNRIAAQISEQGLGDCVQLLGSMPNEEVLRKMRESHIFCFTSDKNEGWGAVLGEAMANGCCPVACRETGAAPFLIKDGENGFLFDLSTPNDLFAKVQTLILNPRQREEMSRKAYLTMTQEWNPRHAASNLLALSQALSNGGSADIASGPCAKAKVL
ncbi:MAG: glycosyltransferase family 4 protein [Bacteroidaceae bacterium]|nr:glycosyltransferase family 4 protein [Bacteroidaceae bacterium]